MVGIASYGAYIPWFRIDRKVIHGAMGWLNPAAFLAGEKSVASYDEDSITMAVSACTDCIKGIDRNKIDGLYFASISPPYRERQNAGIIATALDLKPDIRTADFGGSTKSGTAAIIAALDAVKAGSAHNVLVCAADCRATKPGSPQEQAYGDAAAAFLVSDSDIIGSFQGMHSVSYDFADRWIPDFDKYERIWEDRWVRDEAYNRFITEAVTGLAKKAGIASKDIARLSFPGVYPADHAAIGKKLGLEPRQLQEHLMSTVGNTGTAYPLLLLAAALDELKAKDNVVVASFGNGSDALLFQTTEQLLDAQGKRRGVKKLLATKQMLGNYEKFATFRNAITVDKGIRGETVPWDQKSLAWRYRRQILGLVGSRCLKCGTPQYPTQKICVNPECRAVEQMEPYRFADKTAKLFTYTADNLSFSFNPPSIYGMLDFEGGGRNWFDLTDCELNSVKVGMQLEMSLRRKFTDEQRGSHFYFWKATPPRE